MAKAANSQNVYPKLARNKMCNRLFNGIDVGVVLYWSDKVCLNYDMIKFKGYSNWRRYIAFSKPRHG